MTYTVDLNNEIILCSGAAGLRLYHKGMVEAYKRLVLKESKLDERIRHYKSRRKRYAV